MLEISRGYQSIEGVAKHGQPLKNEVAPCVTGTWSMTLQSNALHPVNFDSS